MEPNRVADLTGKAWKYALAALEHPASLPRLLVDFAKGAHLGELLNLQAPWLRHGGIRTVIDVGAHTGEFSSAVRATLPGVCVYAFEPIPECFSRLTKRLADGPNFKAFPVAIGDLSGSIDYNLSSFTKSSSVLPMARLHQAAFPWSAGSTRISVPIRRLDEYAAEIELRSKVLLKVDVQGYELQVLKGAQNLLPHVDFVISEVSFKPLYEGQALFAEVSEYLTRHGLSFAGFLDELRSPLDDALLQADAIFIRES